MKGSVSATGSLARTRPSDLVELRQELREFVILFDGIDAFQATPEPVKLALGQKGKCHNRLVVIHSALTQRFVHRANRCGSGAIKPTLLKTKPQLTNLVCAGSLRTRIGDYCRKPFR